MDYLEIPGEWVWGDEFNRVIAASEQGEAVVVVGIGADASAIRPEQLKQPKVRAGIWQILARGGYVRLGWIEHRRGPFQ